MQASYIEVCLQAIFELINQQDHIGYKITVVGHSLGGLVAIAAAISFGVCTSASALAPA